MDMVREGTGPGRAKVFRLFLMRATRIFDTKTSYGSESRNEIITQK